VYALLIGVEELAAGMVTPSLRPLPVIVTADGGAPAAVSSDFIGHHGQPDAGQPSAQ